MKPEPLKSDCPFRHSNGENICVHGVIWTLTYSEMGPPGSRQAWGSCDHCAPSGAEPKKEAA